MIVGKLANKILVFILLLSVTPFLLLTYFYIYNIQRIEENTRLDVQQTIGESIDINIKILEDMGKIAIRQTAESVATEAEIYIKSHPNMTLIDLQNNTEFQKIAVQAVGKTGYTAITDYNTLICRFHKDPKIANLDLSTLAEKLPGFWKIMSDTRGGIPVEGFYDWKDPDGTIRSKYMYISIINAKTKDNIGLHVAATTYMDEFLSPSKEISERMKLKMNEMLSEIEINHLNLLRQLLFILYLSIGIISILALLFTRSMVNPIKVLREMAVKIGEGKLPKSIEIKTKDEIGDLALAFSNMTKELRKSRIQIKKHGEELENKVKARTEELNKKIEELTNAKIAMMNMMEDLGRSNKELTEAQGQLKGSLKELRKLDLEKDRFISIAAHELKTPMTAIRGFAQLMENEKIIKNSKLRNRYLKIIEDEIKRLGRLVTEVLDLSRIDLGVTKFTKEDIDLIKFLEEIKEEMSQRAKQKGLHLSFELDKNLPKINTDKEKLKEIMINLIDNSIKYTQKGGVRVIVVRERNYIKFSVSDTGIGIPKRSYKKLFTRFYQIELPYTRKAGGTGLGLSICKEFVEALGGKIWFKSKLGKGTTFYFILPLKAKTK